MDKKFLNRGACVKLRYSLANQGYSLFVSCGLINSLSTLTGYYISCPNWVIYFKETVSPSFILLFSFLVNLHK